MKALIIYGGHRRYGNTETVLENVIAGMDKCKFGIDKVILKELDISPCMSCYSCGQYGKCSIKDDMTGLYDKIRDADVIILASPIYFGSVSSVTKTMIDRCQAFWAAKYIAEARDNVPKKKGYFIAAAGSGNTAVFQSARYTVKLFFLACGAVYSDELLISSTDNIEIKGNAEIIEKSMSFGGKINS